MSSSIPPNHSTPPSSTASKRKGKKGKKPKAVNSTTKSAAGDASGPTSPVEEARPISPTTNAPHEIPPPESNEPPADNNTIELVDSTPDDSDQPPKTSANDPVTAAESNTESGPNKAADGNSSVQPPTPPSGADIESTSLKAQVSELQQRIHDLTSTHEAELQKLKADLEANVAAKEEAESQYEDLQDRVTQLKSNVATRLQRDKEQLEEAVTRIDELESTNDELQRERDKLRDEAAELKQELSEAERELASLRSRSNLSQTNWQRERADLLQTQAKLKEELTSTTNAMGEWEVIALEERSRREAIAVQAAEAEQEMMMLRKVLDETTSDRDTQATTVDGLQRALQEIQDARKRELRDLVDSHDKESQSLRRAVSDAEAKASSAGAAREKLEAEVERMAPFEKEVREKNLLIGKLRHEAIVLNEHLTRSLKYLKKLQPEDQVDRQVISNYLVQFLSLDRVDPKRFQILQIIAGYLNWTEDEKARAGLVRSTPSGTAAPPAAGSLSAAGSSITGGSLRLPSNPFSRQPSTPSLRTEFFTDTTTASTGTTAAGGAASKEGLAELWTWFLHRSADEALLAADSSRKNSIASTVGGSGSGADSLARSASPATPKPAGPHDTK